MMRSMTAVVVALLVCGAVEQHEAQGQAKAVTLMPGLGDLHHSVSTRDPEAQAFFDQGLRLIYAFNHEEAARSFQHAAELDSKLAMAYWGIAEAVGPNYNDPADDDRFKQAYDAIQKALDLSAGASPSERAYIQAMAKRFPSNLNADHRKAAEDYRDAMRGLMKQFPDDPDAATLFAEAGMMLHPWGLWHGDGTPEVGTDEIIATLEGVMRRDPNHVGAIHYYIHTVEASPHPERALAAADKIASLAPAAGHLVHMPAHIYIRTGDYDAAVKTNLKAAEADRAYMQASAAQGMYAAMYYSHNLHFIAICAGMDGDYADARKAADMLAEHVGPYAKTMPPLEAFLTVPMSVDLRFQKWDEIMHMPQPDAAMKLTTVYWHFARGMALAARGKITEAESESKIVADAEHATPPEAPFGPLNSAKYILKIAEDLLAAKIVLAKRGTANAVPLLRDAVSLQDALNYDEPPDWYFPVRESLGAALLAGGNASAAETVFREDLDRNPRNPRSLFGLREALKAQDRAYDAQFVDKEFQSAWKGNEPALKVEDLM